MSAGLAWSTVHANMDFETYCEAGLFFDGRTWKRIEKNAKTGLAVVGAAAYSEHSTCEILSLAYDLKDSRGPHVWVPGCPPPLDLFDHIKSGKTIEAWNSLFEFFIWSNVCVKRMGWPELPLGQLLDTAAKCRALSGPGALGKAADVFDVPIKKDKTGSRLLNKFSVPQKPTKKNPRLRVWPLDDPEDFAKLLSYNIDDIRAEEGVSHVCPDLSPFERNLWELDQRINVRGYQIDVVNLDHSIHIVQQALDKYTAEIKQLTDGQVQSPNQVKEIKNYLGNLGVRVPNLQAETVSEYLKTDIPPNAKRVLQLRQILGSAAVKKTAAMKNRLCSDNRIRGSFIYAGATGTGRWSGSNPQPHNFPRDGISLKKCDQCGRYVGAHHSTCFWCKSHSLSSDMEWTWKATRDVQQVIATNDLYAVEWCYGDPLDTVSSVLRALIIPAPGMEFIASDYSAIEAVVAAELAGETWRQEVFRTHGKIYEASASRITGVPLQEFFDYKKRNSKNHPLRSKIGKIGELASSYGGWTGAWKNFGADKFFKNDFEIVESVKSWRAESPNIVEMWGGQVREIGNYVFRSELYGLEGAAVQAILKPGQCFGYRNITYGVKNDVLYCRLPSGRYLQYHTPRLLSTVDRYSGRPIYQITYQGYKNGQWLHKETYGGKLFENVVQAVARDILGFAMVQLDRHNYPIVLHVHDEPVCEVPEGWGSVDELEHIMMRKAMWFLDWPVKASGGYRGNFFRKG